MARCDGKELAVREGRHGCAPRERAQAARSFKSALERASDLALQAKGRLIAILGAPGRSRTAHVVQLGPIGVEGGREEMPPEGLETGQAGLSGAAGGRGGQGG